MKLTGMIAVAALLLVTYCVSQEMPKPAPELKNIDYFSGSWSLDGDVKASAMGPGGKVVETEKCDWMEGNFYLVCHVEFKSNTMGNGSGLTVMGYSPEHKSFTYREFNSWGEFTDSKGSYDNSTWTWTSEWKMGTMPMNGRFVEKITSPTTYDFTFEMSQDGGAKWSTVMEGKATKGK
jgi:hypothetical protein